MAEQRRHIKRYFAAFVAVIMLFSLVPSNHTHVYGDESKAEQDLKTIGAYFANYDVDKDEWTAKATYAKDSPKIVFIKEGEYTKEAADCEAFEVVRLGRNTGEYENIYDYLQGKAAMLTGRERSEITVSSGMKLKGKGLSGDPTYEMETIDDEGNISQCLGDEYTRPGIMNVKFTIGENGIDKELTIKGFMGFAVQPIQVSPEEKIEFEKKNITFDAIKGRNEAANQIIYPIGRQEYGTVKDLNLKARAYKKTVSIIPSITYKGSITDPDAQNDPKAIELDESTKKVTINRPNVGEADAKYLLAFKISCDTAIDNVEIHLEVPASEGNRVEIRFSPQDAQLVVKDKSKGQVVDDKYITKEAGKHVYNIKAGEYTYELSKEGYIPESGGFTVRDGVATEPVLLKLEPSSEKDIMLKSIELVNPTPDSSVILEQIGNIEAEKDVYTLKVGSTVDSIKINPVCHAFGAEVTVKRYDSEEDAGKGKYTDGTLGKWDYCYLKPVGETTEIFIKVKAPAASTQTVKEKTYTLQVTRGTEKYPLKSVSLKIDGKIDHRAVPKENMFYPEVAEGGMAKEYTAYVNSTASKAVLNLEPAEWVNPGDVKEVKISGNAVDFSTLKYETVLQEGINRLPLYVKYMEGAAEKELTYNLIIIKKKPLELRNVEIDGEATPVEDRIIKGFIDAGADTFKFKCEADSDVKIRIQDEEVTVENGKEVMLKAHAGKMVVKTVILERSVTESNKTWTEMQATLMFMYRKSLEGPTGIKKYLPAPGQFVNLTNFGNAEKTKIYSGEMVTLGAYGGSIIYEFADPIKNDPNNPYGIDFIVYGNVFTNSDGTSAAGAAEPAAVMVSGNGRDWAELAGSVYYDGKTKHNVEITYKNPDLTFKKGAQDVPWKRKNSSMSGVIKKNDYHLQPYYPNYENYKKYLSDSIDSDNKYSVGSMTVKGQSMITDKPCPRYGYGDTHANKEGGSNVAVNPYAENHTVSFNGDGFDLSWGVDKDGNPTNMDYLREIKYVKIYNPVMYDGGSIGESSPEIVWVARAKSSNAPVGISSGLASLEINGRSATINHGARINEGKITFDAQGESKLIFKPVAEDASSNILINDTWVASGKTTKPEMAQSKARIIVQQGDREAKIYTLDIKNALTPEKNTELEKVVLNPKGEILHPNGAGIYESEVSAEEEVFRLTAIPMNTDGYVEIDGKKIDAERDWDSTNIRINKNETKEVEIKVVSEDRSESKVYIVKIKRPETSTAVLPSDEITVSFELTGDGKHGEKVWIAKQNVKAKKGATVKTVTDKMLIQNGIDFVTKNKGTYISKIQVPNKPEYLGEFDNGPNSGWMYRHNGKIADEGYGARILSDGDKIKWFYTDDYKLEKGYEGNFDEKNKKYREAVKAEASDAKTKEKLEITVKVEGTVRDKNGVLSGKADSNRIDKAIDELREKQQETSKKGSKPEIVLKLSLGRNGSDTGIGEILIPGKAIEKIKNNVDVLEISTDYGRLILHKDNIKELMGKEEIGLVVGAENVTSDNKDLKDKLPAGAKSGKLVTLQGNAKGTKISGLKGNYRAEIPYALENGQNPEAVAVFEVGSDGKLKPMLGAAFDVEKKLVEINAKGLNGKFFICYNNPEFTDIGKTWASKDIVYLASRNLIAGKSKNAFDPEARITRAEIVQILANMQGEAVEAGGTAQFTDVDGGEWYGKAVIWAAEAGIISGTGNGRFEPNQPVSRQDLAVILNRYDKYSGTNKLKMKAEKISFKDESSISEYAKASVEEMQKAGIIGGSKQGDGYVMNPKGGATRAEFAAMAARYLKM